MPILQILLIVAMVIYAALFIKLTLKNVKDGSNTGNIVQWVLVGALFLAAFLYYVHLYI